MKKNLLIFVFTAILFRLNGQTCAAPQSSIDITGKQVQARILNGGDLFTDFNSGHFVPDPNPGSPNPSTIFAAGLWIGGVDPAFNLKLAISSFRQGQNTDFWAGPLDEKGLTDPNTCSNWDRHFRVTRARIDAFRQQLPTLKNDPAKAIATFPEIMGWPAKGNPYFFQIWGFELPFADLAPFSGPANDPFYDPLNGDFPVVITDNKIIYDTDEIVWCVFNDQGAGAAHGNSGSSPFQIEVQLTAWTFGCPEATPLDRTVFTAHKIISKATQRIDSVFVGLWVDFDLGCEADDYVGCRPDQNCFFGYNADAVDGLANGTCPSGAPVFSGNPPVQTVTFLNTSLDRFMAINGAQVGTPPPGTTDPSLPAEFYNYLTGRFRDGTSLSDSGSGYNPSAPGLPPVNFAFPGDPANVTEWSMCTENLPLADRRAIGSHYLGAFDPAQVYTLTTAWTAHRLDNLPCNLGKTFKEIQAMRTAYAAGLNAPCLILDTQERQLPAVNISPNPASCFIRIQYGDLDVQSIHLSGLDGRVLRHWQNLEPQEMTLDLSGLPAGVYLVQTRFKQGCLTQKVCVTR